MNPGPAPDATVPFWHSLKGKLVLFFLILDVSTLAVMGLAVGIDATDAIALQIRARLQQSARHSSNTIAEDVRTKWEQMQAISQNTLVVNGVIDTLGREAYLRPFINKLRLPGRGKETPYLAILDYKGRLITANSGHPRRIAQAPAPADEPWLATVFGGRPHGSVFRGDGERQFVRFAFPVFYQNQVEGVLLSEFPLAFVDELLPAADDVATGIVDDRGQVIHGQVPGELAQLANRVAHRGEPEFAEHGDRLYSIVDMPYPEGQIGLKWYLVPSVAATVVSEPVAALLRWMLIVGLFSGLTVTALVVWRAHRFVRPLIRLQQTMQVIMDRGNLAKAAPIESNDEVGLLGSTFNRMIGKLQAQDEALRDEVGVRRRTEGELREANETLLHTVEELRTTQAQLVQSEKMASIGQLAAGVAHEINNPVGFVTSNVHTLRGYIGNLLALAEHYDTALDAEPPDQRANVEAFLKEIDFSYLRDDVQTLLDESEEGLARVAKIVADLKDFSHIDRAEVEIVDLNELLDKVIHVAWNELKYKAEVVREYNALPQVRCYPGRVGQVFLNLLMNAAQAIAQRGQIRIHTEQCGESVVIAVTDTGSGIRPEIIGKIFDPFFTTKPVGKGTGLGLHIAFGIIRDHGGKIEVTSIVGEGTTFTVQLPVMGPQAETVPQEATIV